MHTQKSSSKELKPKKLQDCDTASRHTAPRGRKGVVGHRVTRSEGCHAVAVASLATTSGEMEDSIAS